MAGNAVTTTRRSRANRNQLDDVTSRTARNLLRALTMTPLGRGRQRGGRREIAAVGDTDVPVHLGDVAVLDSTVLKAVVDADVDVVLRDPAVAQPVVELLGTGHEVARVEGEDGGTGLGGAAFALTEQEAGETESSRVRVHGQSPATGPSRRPAEALDVRVRMERDDGQDPAVH